MSFAFSHSGVIAVSRTLTPCFYRRKGGKRAGISILRYVARMPDIRIERAHTIGKEAAVAAALRVAERMHDKAQVKYRVLGDTIEFERTGASGRLVVSDTSVRAEITLGLLMKPMRGMVERKIEEYFVRYFT
jgi:putative polyhydroxyalkanoate system protein